MDTAGEGILARLPEALLEPGRDVVVVVDALDLNSRVGEVTLVVGADDGRDRRLLLTGGHGPGGYWTWLRSRERCRPEVGGAPAGPPRRAFARSGRQGRSARCAPRRREVAAANRPPIPTASPCARSHRRGARASGARARRGFAPATLRRSGPRPRSLRIRLDPASRCRCPS